MKLKTALMLAFVALTFIPILIISMLLYNSGYNLTTESYTQNLTESVKVQTDYISQTMQDNMLSDYKVAKSIGDFIENGNFSKSNINNEILSILQNYLSTSEDKVSVCILADKNQQPVYTMGDNRDIKGIASILESKEAADKQVLDEFLLRNNEYSIGMITPIYNSKNEYSGSFISIYNKSYIFKIISSYYEVANTASYICRDNGEVIDGRGEMSDEHKPLIEDAFKSEKNIDDAVITLDGESGKSYAYCKSIENLPWYLVGVVGRSEITSFMNQFIWVYILIALVILVADIILAILFSQRVVAPINGLIQVIEHYPESIINSNDEKSKEKGYFETRYLKTKFLKLMKDIILAQHNFEGMLQLYQSGAMGDIHIDIDVKEQTIHSNSTVFENLIQQVKVRDGACVVERFTNCFCEKDQILLMEALEDMRDRHLSVIFENVIYTPFMQQSWYNAVIMPTYDQNRLSRLLIQLRNISNFKEQEIQSKEKANRDPLTKLYNRAGLEEYVNKVVQQNQGATSHCLLFIDMNYFKMVNDNFGHHAGDQLLCSIAEILKNHTRDTDIVARIGGDEFVIFMENVNESVAQNKKAELEKSLVFPYSTETTTFEVSASLGVAVWNQPSDETLEQLLNRADEHMYNAKREFKLNKA